MASGYEVEVTLTSAKDLKNVNWRHGPNRSYAVVWVDPNRKSSTKVDEEGDTSPHWNETLVIPLPGRGVDEDTTLCVDIVHSGHEDDTKKLIGAARLKLIDVLNDVGYGERVSRSLKLKRPSGRPQGKVEVKVCVREPPRYTPRGGYYEPSYGIPYGQSPPPPQPQPYGYGYPYNQPSGYSNNAYNAPPPPQPQTYHQAEAGGYSGQVEKEKKSSKFGGMGTGLAVGAVAGVLGGIALSEGFDALEDKISDDVAEKVEDDLGYDDCDGDE